MQLEIVTIALTLGDRYVFTVHTLHGWDMQLIASDRVLIKGEKMTIDPA